MYSVMWSEHCSYKSSKVHLRQFGDKAPKTDALLVGIGENAGVVDIGDGWAVTFKVESHNHPSYVEPYQGAATGIGGIVRDIISMGARPLGGHGSLALSVQPTHLDTRRVLPGVVSLELVDTATVSASPISVANWFLTKAMPETRWLMRCVWVL